MVGVPGTLGVICCPLASGVEEKAWRLDATAIRGDVIRNIGCQPDRAALSDATHQECPRSNVAKYLAGWNRAHNKPFPTQAETAHHLAASWSVTFRK
jgi:hypothetical protein